LQQPAFEQNEFLHQPLDANISSQIALKSHFQLPHQYQLEPVIWGSLTSFGGELLLSFCPETSVPE
jgi:hypothetical protein